MLVPSLEKTNRRKLTKLRELALDGVILVDVEDIVDARSVIAKAELPGELRIHTIYELTGCELDKIKEFLKVSVGDTVSEDDLLFKQTGLFGLFSTEVKAKSSGVIEYFTEENGHLAIRETSKEITLKAYISGKVVHVEPSKSATIETEASVIQGIFGVGGESYGELLWIDASNERPIKITDFDNLKLEGKIVLGGIAPDIEVLNYLAQQKVAGLVVSSITSKSLTDYLGYSLGLAITGNEDIPFTLFVTEGFGEVQMSTAHQEIFSKLSGSFASINGATQVRAGAMRPELIVSNTKLEASIESISAEFTIGQKVKIITEPYFALVGEIVSLPKEPQKIPTGSYARVLNLKLESGEEVMVPRANVELV